ncbi:BlaI/MecI/CopY family transcriptional regulator [Muricomes intestini]|uniref:BlaI/MecI/CopY family transcriptional regulator n=1 Tax=Muricomes intestini TaxID=1796634 RepID=UPI002FE1D5D3
MNSLKKLPGAEFEVMKTIWANEPPVTTNMLMEQLGNQKGWKLQTLITLLLRLVDRGFVRTEKNGKQRTYYPLVDKERYLEFETSSFIERFHDHSIVSLVNTLYDGKDLNASDLDALSRWLKKRGE